MTTNVYDAMNGLLASDSRWSIRPTGKNFIVYVDSAPFQKIEISGNTAFMFAGNACMIDRWKQFIRSNPSSSAGHPPLREMALLIFDTHTRQIVEEYGQQIRLRDADTGACVAMFTGSGGIHAVECWKMNFNAIKAVNTAKVFDPASGGQVKFVDAVNGTNNIPPCQGVGCLSSSLTNGGMVMYLNGPGKEVPFQEAANNDPEVDKVRQQVANGEVVFSAPCDAMFNMPSTEDVKRIEQALDKVFGD